MVNKITTPPTTSELIGTVNEIIDDKQDTLVSGTNIKTINNTSILGSGNIDIQGGSSLTAGTGIDITNDVISVTNAISTGAALGATALQPSALNGYATENWVGQQGYITGITSGDVTTALGYTPYNSSNPSGYITSSALDPYALSTDLASVATSGSYNDLSNKPDLNGKANIDLSNCTKPHIVETYNNGTSWYRVYSDGWCEQGSFYRTNVMNTNINVTLLKAYKNTNYTILTTLRNNNTTGAGFAVVDNTGGITTTSFYVKLKHKFQEACSPLGFFWETKGYIGA